MNLLTIYSVVMRNVFSATPTHQYRKEMVAEGLHANENRTYCTSQSMMGKLLLLLLLPQWFL